MSGFFYRINHSEPRSIFKDILMKKTTILLILTAWSTFRALAQEEIQVAPKLTEMGGSVYLGIGAMNMQTSGLNEFLGRKSPTQMLTVGWGGNLYYKRIIGGVYTYAGVGEDFDSPGYRGLKGSEIMENRISGGGLNIELGYDFAKSDRWVLAPFGAIGGVAQSVSVQFEDDFLEAVSPEILKPYTAGMHMLTMGALTFGGGIHLMRLGKIPKTQLGKTSIGVKAGFNFSTANDNWMLNRQEAEMDGLTYNRPTNYYLTLTMGLGAFSFR